MWGKCPLLGGPHRHTAAGTTANQHWWPPPSEFETCCIRNSALSDPMGESFNYAEEFKSLDLDAVVADLHKVMTDSQDWWPGGFRPFTARCSSAMTWPQAPARYRVADGRGGGGASGDAAFRAAEQLARQRQSRQGAAAALAGQEEIRPEALLGRPDDPRGRCRPAVHGLQDARFSAAAARMSGEPEEDIYWGSETVWLGDERYTGDRELETPLAAVQMGLIYVNPEGPNGKPDPVASGRDIRETFARMAMNDEETVALVAGGHAFGKAPWRGRPPRMSARRRRAPASRSRTSAGRTASATARPNAPITSGIRGRAVDRNPDDLGQQLSGTAVQIRLRN